ncbi:MAG: alpha/beta hydrolase [Bacteroidota bacterium]
MVKHLVFIPGLGFDQRIFEQLELPGCSLYFLDWIEPLPEESLRNYAARMAKRLPPEVKQWVLVGHSFGGILAQEMTVFLPADRVILLSSIQKPTENPWFSRSWLLPVSTVLLPVS